ncbi:cell division protein SepF [Planosporangium flavigriseum]|uniref:Cell division protein SepF n=1 Tax=Planosporangium flavigriseum TaxID=373681 RepID=A0A8J3LJF1_9ACTN|nr:cell division protein SepF [Planosporangium flavigriseum]NJC65156.1 cell division protein SepF [Planosporangium flavigriseum]GIG71773.1 cell division protein SepF 1 [Planosporangium flavigriseum]
MGSLRKTGVWLGLAEDSEEDLDEDDYTADELPVRSRRHPAVRAAAARAAAERAAAERRLPVPVDSAPEPETEPMQIATIHARGFRDARIIGEYFRQDVPVIIDLSGLDDPDARRIVDFAAGLIFGRRGNIHRLTRGVFLLSPLGTAILTGEGQKSSGGDFFDQA